MKINLRDHIFAKSKFSQKMRDCASQICKNSAPQICKISETQICRFFKFLQNCMVWDKFTKAHICKNLDFAKKIGIVKSANCRGITVTQTKVAKWTSGGGGRIRNKNGDITKTRTKVATLPWMKWKHSFYDVYYWSLYQSINFVYLKTEF